MLRLGHLLEIELLLFFALGCCQLVGVVMHGTGENFSHRALLIAAERMGFYFRSHWPSTKSIVPSEYSFFNVAMAALLSMSSLRRFSIQRGLCGLDLDMTDISCFASVLSSGVLLTADVSTTGFSDFFSTTFFFGLSIGRHP